MQTFIVLDTTLFDRLSETDVFNSAESVMEMLNFSALFNSEQSKKHVLDSLLENFFDEYLQSTSAHSNSSEK